MGTDAELGSGGGAVSLECPYGPSTELFRRCEDGADDGGSGAGSDFAGQVSWGDDSHARGASCDGFGGMVSTASSCPWSLLCGRQTGSQVLDGGLSAVSQVGAGADREIDHQGSRDSAPKVVIDRCGTVTCIEWGS